LTALAQRCIQPRMRLVPGQIVSLGAAALGANQVHQCAALLVLPFAEIEQRENRRQNLTGLHN
jgi:hypothetical protein